MDSNLPNIMTELDVTESMLRSGEGGRVLKVGRFPVRGLATVSQRVKLVGPRLKLLGDKITTMIER